MPSPHFHSRACASIPGHTASSPETEPLRSSETMASLKGAGNLGDSVVTDPEAEGEEFRAPRLQLIPTAPPTL